MKRLLIATTNKYRLDKLRNIINNIRNDIKIVTLDQIESVSSTERGNDVLKVIKQKMNHYRKFYSGAILVEDDGLDLFHNPNPQAKIKRSNFKTQKELFDFWFDELGKGSIKGILKKVYGLHIKGCEHIEILEIPIELIPLNDRPNKICYNPLNHFIKPDGFENTIEDFSDEERVRYNEKLISKLSNILLNI